MQQMFESPETEAIILVDGTNAFNSLNRQAALRNIRHLCPPLSKILINTYREDVRLFIDGETLLSQEGTTQGDPLAMAMYATAVNPLMHRLKQNKSGLQTMPLLGESSTTCENGGIVSSILAQSMSTSRMHQKHGSL